VIILSSINNNYHLMTLGNRQDEYHWFGGTEFFLAPMAYLHCLSEYTVPFQPIRLAKY
jgi:hypothetical protein